MSGFVRARVAEAVQARAEIRDAPDDVARAIQEARHRVLEGRMADVRALGDAVLACFFGNEKPRAREGARQRLAVMPGGNDAMWAEVRRLAATVGHGAHPMRPFHWEVEFPEVFTGNAPGFDAIVGNPPFAGKNTLINSNRECFLDWLQTIHAGAHGNADLVAHFFRRAFALLRSGGCLGLIATNTVGQGDTRESGLRAVIAAGGAIARATRRLPWPGEAAVVVSVVHVRKGAVAAPMLDERPVRRISAYLVEGDLDASPARLAANAGKSFEGVKLIGIGFVFDDAAASQGKTSSLSEMQRLIDKDQRNAERIIPYIGGEEINTSPTHAHQRYCIDFNDFPLRRDPSLRSWFLSEGSDACDKRRREWLRDGIVPGDYPAPVAADWPDLLEIVERLVKADRAKQKREALRKRWWQYAEKRPGMRAALSALAHHHVLSRVSSHHAPTSVGEGMLCSDATTVFADDRPEFYGVLQCRAHELWAAFFASSLEDRLRYGPSDCFETFPLPRLDARELCDVAEAYRTYRANLMRTNQEGLTKTYNRFLNRPGFVGGSNFQIGWSPYEQDDEQILP